MSTPDFHNLGLHLTALADEIERINRANGWFDDDRTFGDEMALLTSEVMEGFEAFRDDGFEDVTLKKCLKKTGWSEANHVGATDNDNLPHVCKPEGVGSEMADVLIRLLDTCKRHNIDLAAETKRKLAYNETRGYRHGGKAI